MNSYKIMLGALALGLFVATGLGARVEMNRAFAATGTRAGAAEAEDNDAGGVEPADEQSEAASI